MPLAASPARPPRHRSVSSLLSAGLLLAAAACGAGPERTAPPPARSAAVVTTASGAIAVLTQRFDNGRTGLNAAETALTPTTVRPGSFAKRASQAVDGAVYAQPLLVPGLTIHGALHDVLFVATEHDSVYALDATTLQILWQISLLSPTYGADPRSTTVSSSDVRCSDISPEYGVTGTPVVDLGAGRLYVVSNTKEGHGGSIVYRLHALDLLSGAPATPSAIIQASISGSGAGSRRGGLTFNPTRHLQRPGLLLANGLVTIGFSGHCDVDPYHGWVMAYDASSLQQRAVWATAPNGTEAGVWMSGGGIAADDAGNAYLSIGNGTFDGTTAYGNSVVRLDLAHLGGSVPVLDSFTPYDQATLSSKDLDLGSGGILVVPDTQAGRNVLVVGGKAGTLYVLDRSYLGGYSASANQNLQTIVGAGGAGVYSTPGYWNGSIYVQGKGDPLEAFAFDATTGLLGASPTSRSPTTSGFPGTSPVVSANGLVGAIVWTVQTDGYGSGAPAVLHAYEATNVANELYASSQVAGDQAGPAVKFVVPVVANGSVYVGASKLVTRYGLQ